MPKHRGWRGRKFYIGDFKVAEVSIKRTGAGLYRVTVSEFERTVHGALLGTRRAVRDFPTGQDAYRYAQDAKHDISKKFRGWVRVYG